MGNTVLAGESWGYELFKHEIGMSRRFVLAFTLLMLIVILLLLNRSRPTMSMKRWWLLAVGALILAAAAFAPYASLWQTRYASVAERIGDPSVSWVNSDPRPWDGRLKVSQYDISLQRQKDDTLLMTAKLTVPVESRKGRTALPLTLHRSFQVNKVLVQGADAQYRRQGDFIDAELPQGMQDDLQIEIVYGGKIMDFSPRYGSERYAAFSVGSEVNLPRYMAWYPLIGHQDIYFKDEPPNELSTGISFRPLHYPPAKMKLTVEGYKVPLYAGIPEKERKTGYQRFEGDGVTGLSLFGSRDWTEIWHEGLPVTMVAAPYDQEYVENQMKDLKKKYDYFSSWIPELAKRDFHILYWGGGRYSYDRINGGMENAMIISSDNSYYNNVVDSLPGEWMNFMLFGSQNGLYMYSSDQHPETDVRSRISSLFWYVYYRQESGLSDKELVNGYYWTRSVQLLLFKDNDYDPNGIGRKMAKQVSRALRKGKERQVQEVLLHFL
ncbi:hypothetical protein [Paenibacillus sp. DMB20]|uniref:hypothetical protein n=1 Tax=Paenibacillus sp. DMB20 TaxID=1642570 RepID=UPI000A582B78|nr:hypothetical protein [Paenibacillus sp. DMB20]